MRIDKTNPYFHRTHIYDKEGKERYFKWIDYSNGKIIQAEEWIIAKGKPFYPQVVFWHNTNQFDVIIDGIKNPTNEQLEHGLKNE